MFITICYDICDNKRRRRLRKLLRSYGEAAQESVFEADLRASQIAKLRTEIAALVKEGDDVRWYRQCTTCAGHNTGPQQRRIVRKAVII